MNEEAIYVCSHCGEEIVVPIDVSTGTHQDYTEDCPVCCEPMSLHVDLDERGNPEVQVRAEQDFGN